MTTITQQVVTTRHTIGVRSGKLREAMSQGWFVVFTWAAPKHGGGPEGKWVEDGVYCQVEAEARRIELLEAGDDVAVVELHATSSTGDWTNAEDYREEQAELAEAAGRTPEPEADDADERTREYAAAIRPRGF